MTHSESRAFQDHTESEVENSHTSSLLRELTEKEVGLRPTLSEDISREWVSLIHACWADDPDVRPSFSVILQRLTIMDKRNLAIQGMRSGRDHFDSTLRDFCRAVHSALWLCNSNDFDQEAASWIFDPAFTASATNTTLNEVLKDVAGAEGAESLGWMMFGGLEDGTEILPEPLLDDDIVCSSGFCLLTFRFGAKAPNKSYQWRGEDDREFGKPCKEREREREREEGRGGRGDRRCSIPR